MAEIPTLKETQPILQAPAINSTAEGHEAFGKMLASLSSTVAEETIKINNEESKSQYVTAAANIDALKTSAQINLVRDPNSGPHVTQQTNELLDIITENTKVNESDRTNLKAYAKGVSGSVSLAAAKTEVGQQLDRIQLQHGVEFPSSVHSVTQQFMMDPAAGEKSLKANIQNIENLASIHAMSVPQALSEIKILQHAVEVANDAHILFRNQDATAEDYHQQNAHLIGEGLGAFREAPVNENTAWLTRNYNEDHTFRGVMSDVLSGNLPNVSDFTALSDNQRHEVLATDAGRRMAMGKISAEVGFPVVARRYSELSEKSESQLSLSDRAEKQVLGNYVKTAAQDGYTAVQNTPTGHGIAEDFNKRNAAIQSLWAQDIGNSSDPVILQTAQNKYGPMMYRNLNQTIDKMRSFQTSLGLPNINPIPPALVNAASSSFVRGGDPNTLFQTIGQLNPQNQLALASAMPTTEQQFVVKGIAFAPPEMPQHAKEDFVYAQQAAGMITNPKGELVGRTTKEPVYKNMAIDSKGHAVTNKDLQGMISIGLRQQQVLNGLMYNNRDSLDANNALIKTTLNYANYLAGKDNNLTMNQGHDANYYVTKASEFYMHALQPMSGSNFIVNERTLPIPMGQEQLQILADHVTNEGYALMIGRPQYETDSAISHNPLKMIITDSGLMQAVDTTGRPYFSMPFSSDVHAYAAESNKRRQNERNLEMTEYENRQIKRQNFIG